MPEESGAPGFRRVDTANAVFVAHADFEAGLRALGFPDREAVEARLAHTASSGRSATAAVALPDRPERIHLRPMRHGGLLAPLWGERIASMARPLQELRVTETLRARGAPVPRVAAAVGWPAAPLWRAVLGTVHVERSRDGVAWLAAGPPPEEIAAVAAAAGRAVRAFHEAGGRHADLHLKNLLVDADERVWVIDLDKARAGDPPSPRRRMAELVRLYRSLLKRGVRAQVGEAGRDAFFTAYTAEEPALTEALLRHWPRERRRMARHARGYDAPG